MYPFDAGDEDMELSANGDAHEQWLYRPRPLSLKEIQQTIDEARKIEDMREAQQ